MRLLTTREAAEMLSEGMGRNITAARIEDAIQRGRLQAEKDPGDHDRYLVSPDESATPRTPALERPICSG